MPDSITDHAYLPAPPTGQAAHLSPAQCTDSQRLLMLSCCPPCSMMRPCFTLPAHAISALRACCLCRVLQLAGGDARPRLPYRALPPQHAAPIMQVSRIPGPGAGPLLTPTRGAWTCPCPRPCPRSHRAEAPNSVNQCTKQAATASQPVRIPPATRTWTRFGSSTSRTRRFS